MATLTEAEVEAVLLDQLGALGEVMTYSATGLSAGTHYFWARAYDAASNPSAAAGPVSATIT